MHTGDLANIGLYFGYICALGIPMILLAAFCKVPFEPVRKMYHLIVTLQIFPLVMLFDAWYMAVMAAFLLVLIAYPLLALVEHTRTYKRIAVERTCGEFKRSLVIVQATVSILICFFWGVLGSGWKYIAVVAVLAWGLGDAGAALIGKAFGRHPIRHRWADGKKTLEGTQAMFVISALAIFATLLFYGGQPWHISLAVALLAAPVCAVVELFSRGGMDTLTVPISAGLSVLSLMMIFSFLGA